MFAIKATRETIVKRFPGMESHNPKDFDFKPADMPLLVNRMELEEYSHYEIELAVPIQGFYNWFVFKDHVTKVDPPEFYLTAVEDTVIKRYPISSGELKKEDKFDFKLHDRPLQANWIKPEGSKYYQISLIKAHNGIHNWYAFAEHVEASKVLAPVPVS